MGVLIKKLISPVVTAANAQGGDSTHELTGGPGLGKKIIVPKKFLRLPKNTNCGKIGLTQSATRPTCSSYVKNNNYK